MSIPSSVSSDAISNEPAQSISISTAIKYFYRIDLFYQKLVSFTTVFVGGSAKNLPWEVDRHKTRL